MKVKLSPNDRVFYVVNYSLLLLFSFFTLYPFLFVLSASLSDSLPLAQGKVWIYPIGINISSYRMVLKDPQVWLGYKNTIWYVLVGTGVNLFLTLLTAYPLSRRTFGGRRVIMLLIAFTMFFSGGMVPTYLLIRNLGLINSPWAIVLSAGINTWNLIITRSFFEALPEELFESAHIFGCNDFQILLMIILPLSGAIIAVMVLFYAVARWNEYFSAILYLTSEKYWPLQSYMRRILIQYQQNESNAQLVDISGDRQAIAQTIRYATIIVATVPTLCVYPFLQKYFVKGVMVGAIKG